MGYLRHCDANVIVQPHEDRPVQATGVKDHFFVLLDQRVRQDLELIVERKRGNRPDNTSRDLLGLLARDKGDTIRLKVLLKPVKVNPAIARDVGKTVDIVFSIEPHLDDDRLDRLLYSISANLRDDLCASFRLMLDDAIDGALLIEQVT